MIRLVDRGFGIVGEGEHHSGWPYTLSCINPLISENGILFDDFTEASFSYHPIKSPHLEPWVGVFHLPYDAPEFLLSHDNNSSDSIISIIKSPKFKASLPFLKFGITLSSPLATWLQKTLNVPFVSLIFPTETPRTIFSETVFLSNTKKRIIQAGWFLKNTSAIYQLKVPDNYIKTCLLPQAQWAKEHMNRVADFWKDYQQGNRPDQLKAGRVPFGIVENLTRVSNEIYDHLFSENIIFIEFFSVAASNIVVECIARNTPLVVNRLPALEEYLGRDYPLFFDRIESATSLFTIDKILDGHRYLKDLDKAPFTGRYFRQQLTATLKRKLQLG